MININNIKTIPQSINYLNRVILGISETNQVIPKAYTSAFPVQERLDDLEEKSNNTLADISALNGEISALNGEISALNEVVEELVTATEDTGWIKLTADNASIDQSTYNVFIRKIGKVVTITGHFITSETMNPYPPTNLVASFPTGKYTAKIDSNANRLVGFYTLSGTRTKLVFASSNNNLTLSGVTVPSGAQVFIPNITYIINH